MSAAPHADLLTWAGIAGGAVTWVWREAWLRMDGKRRRVREGEAEALHRKCELERVALKAEVARLSEKLGLAEERAATAWKCYTKVANNE